MEIRLDVSHGPFSEERALKERRRDGIRKDVLFRDDCFSDDAQFALGALLRSSSRAFTTVQHNVLFNCSYDPDFIPSLEYSLLQLLCTVLAGYKDS